MQVSARVHYGCLAMLELALRHHQERPVALREIVARHGIPQPFLVQILQSLRAANLVIRTRGSGGGYRLSMSPDQVSVLDIAEAIGCGDTPSSIGEAESDRSEGETVRALWARADDAARAVLSTTSLSDLVASCEDSSSTMFYI